MKKGNKILAFALSSVLMVSSLAAFAACGGSSDGGNEALVARICYENVGKGLVPDSAKTYTVKDAVSYKEYRADGTPAESGTVAKVSGGTATAVGKGYVVFTLKDGSTQRVDVEPAYVTDPGNEYHGSSDSSKGSALLGGTHDPSFIEVEEDGKPAYYLFSTGWDEGNEIRKSTDLIHWQYLGKATSVSTKLDAVSAWEEEPNRTSSSTGEPSIQWWAPDIVPAHGGGYWLYTCCVSNTAHLTYSKACIVLFHSDSLAAGSFQYVGVLMQSAIPNQSAYDVNSIDPQIIYTPDGKMYMAYGSFGYGNWMLELDPVTGLRKDNFYKDPDAFLSLEQVRAYRDEADEIYEDFKLEKVVEHEFYGRMISYRAMEAPVIARHDNVTVMNEYGKVLQKGKTFYYSMHSYNGLAEAYQMWGGRSENVLGTYRSTLSTPETYGVVSNTGVGSSSNAGNKYMGRFSWADKETDNIDIILPGHNDLFTNSVGTNLAAYITRSLAYGTQSGGGYDGGFVSQIHQYYLNSMGDIVINPNRYGGEVNRAVSEQELFRYTQDRTFKMVVFANDDALKTSVYVKLEDGGKISYEGETVGTWKMYGGGYIYFHFTDTESIEMLDESGESTFYGVVRPAWLEDQGRSGFTITCMGRTPSDDEDENNRSMAMFMNNVSTLMGTDTEGNSLGSLKT